MESYNVCCFKFKQPVGGFYKYKTAKVYLTKYTPMVNVDPREMQYKYEVWIESCGNRYNTLEEIALFIIKESGASLNTDEKLEILNKLNRFNFE